MSGLEASPAAAAPATFGERFLTAAGRFGPLCVGIDPHPELLEQWGLRDDISGLREFSLRCVEVFAGRVALVKPQVAFFEAYGAGGLAVLEEVIAAFAGTGTLVLSDAKRGDIGSTMKAYAAAWLGPGSPLASDAVTISPFLGTGALQPAFELAVATGRAVFVLARTSNPEGSGLQHSVDAAGRSVSEQVLRDLARRNADVADPSGCGPFGAVVGATLAEAPEGLSELHGPVLMPGVGAQGATLADVRRLAGKNADFAIPTVSRDILRAGPAVSALKEAVSRWSQA